METLTTKTEAKELSDQLSTIAYLTGLRGNQDDQWKSMAYANASKAIRGYRGPMKYDDLVAVGAIGDSIAKDLLELSTRGVCQRVEDLKHQIKAKELASDNTSISGRVSLTNLRGVGAKGAERIKDRYGVETVQDLAGKAANGVVQDQRLINAISFWRQGSDKLRIDVAMRLARRYIQVVGKAIPGVRGYVAGSTRRLMPLVKDLDIAFFAKDTRWVPTGTALAKALVEKVGGRIESAGVKQATWITPDNLVVNLLGAPWGCRGALMRHATGPAAFNKAIAVHAHKQNLFINDKGVWTLDQAGKPDQLVEAENELRIFHALGLPWIPPTMRMNLSEANFLSKYRPIHVNDVQADLHTHTWVSDGQGDVSTLVQYAQKRGLRAVAVANHTPALTKAGSSWEAILAEYGTIDMINATSAAAGIRLLKSIEAEVLSDGTLDLHPEVVHRCDFVIAGAHRATSGKDQTDRILRAISHPKVKILAHPTGRRLLIRDEMQVDWGRVFHACAAGGVALEVNGQPERMDLSWPLIRIAGKFGCKFALTSDMHGERDYGNLELAVAQFSRGLGTKEQLIRLNVNGQRR